VTKEAALVAQAADPLGNGVRIILLLGFGCSAVLSVVGVLTYTALTMRSRQVDWAVLRALGIGSGQLLMLIGAEQCFVVGGSIIAGLLVGLLLARTTGPFLQVVTSSIAGGRLVFDWLSLLLLVGGLLAALLLALIVLVALNRRNLTHAFRLGEM